MPAGQQVAFEPALAGVLGQDLHHPAAGREMLVVGQALGLPRPLGRLEHGGQPVGGGLVGAEDAEISVFSLSRITSRR